MQITESRTYIAIPPGETIKEIMDEHGVSQEQLASWLGKDEAFVQDLIGGDVELTESLAGSIEKAIGIPAYFLLNLERLYREKLLKVAQENAQEAEHKAKADKRKVLATALSGLAASG